MNELSADLCLITETWFKETDLINNSLEDFKNRSAYCFLRRDRQGERRGGGVAVCFRPDRIQFSKAKIPPTKHEIYAAIGRRTGQRRKILVVVIYIPPFYNAEQNRSLYRKLNKTLFVLKDRYENPYVILGGDFNRRDARAATLEHPELKIVSTGATRDGAALDLVLSNFNHSVIDAGTVDPIRSDTGASSDHRTVFVSFRMPRVPSYDIEQYSYYHLTDAGHSKFGQWLDATDWGPLEEAAEVDLAVELLHSKFEQGMAASYEFKKRKKKSSEPAWMTDWLRQDIDSRRTVFKTDKGRSERWKILKAKTNATVKKRKKRLDEFILQKFDNESNPGNFFHHLKSLLGKNSGERWSPTKMFPGLQAKEVAEELAIFFNSISSQYDPLKKEEIPSTFLRTLPTITKAEVEKKFKTSKKPTSTVTGDIPALLYGMFPEKLSAPVTHIFNLIVKEKQWPKLWKVEHVTVIPKGNDPHDPSECRNISCTNFLSKIFESFVMGWSREEVKPKLNQFGGEPKASATHLLIEVISDITSALEDNRSGVVLSAIDFSKAFNRLDHAMCLKSFAKKGASTEVLQLLAAFLMGRNMSVRVEGERSSLRPVNAGAPQGSVLGCYLFNVGVDDLEDEFVDEQQTPEQEEAHTEVLHRRNDFPAASTPMRVGSRPSTAESPIMATTPPPSIELLPRVANAPHWIPKPKDPAFHCGKIKSYKFVDDGVNTNKVNMKRAQLLEDGTVHFKEIIDLRSQRLLEHVSRRAEDKGMLINASKTGLMLVSASTSFEARVRVELGGKTITGADRLKLLGVTIDSDMSFRTHARSIAARMRAKSWALSKLRKKGLAEEKLVRTYKTLIRPSVEYAAPAWHSMIGAGLAADIEKQQVQALRNIYGPNISANKLRLRAGVELLSKRREEIVRKFANKCVNNPRCKDWFQKRNQPVYARRMNVKYPIYRETFARTDRHKNNPKNYLVKKLNEQ